MLEPQAAAIATGAASKGAQTGLIVDIGGGTSDFSVFRAGRDWEIEIIANHGVRIGGTDFDKALSISVIMPLLGKGTELRKEMGPGLTPTPNAIFNDLATWEKIPFLYTGKTRKMVADMAKLAVEPEKLSRLSEVLLNELGHDLAFLVEAGKIAANDGSGDARIDLRILERDLGADLTQALMADALAQEMDAIGQAALETVRRAACEPEQIDQIIYVGGSSLISLIPARMRAFFPDAPHKMSDVFTAVANGLAIASARA
jgi:hypothetical chaperone protein